MARKTTNRKNKTIKTSKKNLELYWIFGIMVLMLIIILLIPWISRQLNTFKYDGLTFTKEKFGQLPVYHYYYSFDFNNEVWKYNLYLRLDPRKNNVPVSGEIKFPKIGSTVFISINSTAFTTCRDTLSNLASLADLLSGNKYPVKGGVLDKNDAIMSNVTHITCQTNPKTSVITINAGNETKIISDGNCNQIIVSDCEMLEAVEKFKVQAVADAKKRSE